MLSLKAPLGAKMILDRLHEQGYEAYVVGGCVRDSLIGKEPKDWDICTNAKPSEVESCLSGFKIIKTGIQHGTITIVLDAPYEVTTYRVDGGYEDHRRPKEVIYSASLHEDLSRRDFTINAMAWNEKGLVDIFGGVDDIEWGVIRCVGNPDDRLREDALRIMRALRFASVYSMMIDPQTESALHRNAHLLEHISKERIRDELCKLVVGNGAFDVMLWYRDIVFQVIPELKPCDGFNQNNPYHCYDVYDHICHAVCDFKGTDLTIKLALLLHDIGKPRCYAEDERGGHFYGHAEVSAEMADTILSRLKFDNATRNDVVELIRWHNEDIKPTKRVVRRWLNRIGEKQFYRLLEVRKADIAAHSEIGKSERFKECEEVRSTLETVLAERDCFTLKDLNIDGKAILDLGVLQGKEIGRILNLLLQEVIDGSLTNDHQALLERAKKEVGKWTS